MEAREIICSAVLPQDIQRGLDYAVRSLPYTIDRMNYGRQTIEAHLKRLRNIALGKCAEAALIRFLRAHGVQHNSIEGKTRFDRPDLFDLRIHGEIVDVKAFWLADQYAQTDQIINALALIPNRDANDQWALRHRYHRYIFLFFTGRFRLVLKQRLATILHDPRPLTTEELHIKSHNLRIFITAAPTVTECEEKFRRIRKRTRCLQYPFGTRIENMGCRIRDLTAFAQVVQWGGV